MIILSCSDKESKLVVLEKTICELKRKLNEIAESHNRFVIETADIKEQLIEEKSVSLNNCKNTTYYI